MRFYVILDDFWVILSNFGGCGDFGALKTKLLVKMG
jgi:hypothetical protein